MSHSPGVLELLLLLLPKLLVVMVHHAQGALGHHQALRLPRLPACSASWPSAFCRDPATAQVSKQTNIWDKTNVPSCHAQLIILIMKNIKDMVSMQQLIPTLSYYHNHHTPPLQK